jgi:hypothetical protein
MIVRHFRLLLLAAVAVATPLQATDEGPAATFAALAAVDGQLAAIGQRLVTANAALCAPLAPSPGWVLHALDQYDPALRPAARARYGFATMVGVEAVVPGSAAAQGGVVAGDSLMSINGLPVAAGATAATASTAARDAALALVARQPAGQPLRVTLVRAGQQRDVVIPAAPGCAAGFEVMLGDSLAASSDGRLVQVGVRFLARYNEAEVAAVTAHELAHIVLRHRVRLEAAGVSSGLLAEVGRNGRLHRRAEDEADRLSVALLYNAGYDPRVAARFWRAHGGEVDGGFFRSRTHPSSKARAEAVEAEIAAIPIGAPRPYSPALLATRDAPFQ